MAKKNSQAKKVTVALPEECQKKPAHAQMDLRKRAPPARPKLTPPTNQDTKPTKQPIMLVSAKERKTEDFIKGIVDTLPNTGHVSAAEASKIWTDSAKQKLNDFSVTFSHKVSPLVNILLEKKMVEAVSKNFVQIEPLQLDDKQLVQKYASCFNAWVDAKDHVSFKATNQKLVGGIDVKDLYILTLFVFATCQRTKNDNLLQLGLVGISTSGKSTLFESILMEGSHVTTMEAGVGRFNMGNKPVLMFHDIDIRTLVASTDTVKIKTLCRTEPTVAKIHGATINLGPVFVFYSSNKRLMSHKFTPVLDCGDNRLRWQFYATQVQEAGRKKIFPEDLAALQNRFIECFVRAPPPLPEDLPSAGGFQRIHGVMGLLPRVIGIMEKYNKSSFASPLLISYVIHGIVCNTQKYFTLMEDTNIFADVGRLLDKYVSDQGQKQHLIERMEEA